MSKQAPRVYLLYGEDEYAIARFIRALRRKVGDEPTTELNLTSLDGRTLTFDELVTATQALPFLARRRLVILTNPTAFPKSEGERKRFLHCLEQVPQSTALVLVEQQWLTDKQMQKKGEVHWLEKWAQENSAWVLVRAFRKLTGADMVAWIQEQAGEAGGMITTEAARLLASKVGENPRLAAQEIEKLLAYVHFQRPVEEQDIERLTTDQAEVSDFALVNALRVRDCRQATAALQKMLEKGVPVMILGSIVYSFRLMLCARELLDEGYSEEEVQNRLVKELSYPPHVRVHPFTAAKAVEHARGFSLTELEHIYRRLIETDIAIKSGEMEGALALEVLVTNLTN